MNLQLRALCRFLSRLSLSLLCLVVAMLTPHPHVQPDRQAVHALISAAWAAPTPAQPAAAAVGGVKNHANHANNAHEIPAERTTASPADALSPELMYQILLAEIAGQRGSLPLATHLYADLAKATGDGRIARRATEVALYVRQTELALDSAQIWVAAEPDSADAQQTIAGLYLNLRQPEAALPHLGKLLTLPIVRRATRSMAEEFATPDAAAAADEEAAAAAASLSADKHYVARLNQIYRMLYHYPDKTVVPTIIEQLLTSTAAAAAEHAALPAVQLVRAQAQLDAKHEAQALEIVEQVLARQPAWVPGVLFKAQVLRGISSKQAAQTLRQFLQQQPQAEDISDVRLAYARMLIGDKHYVEARREFDLLLKENRDHPEVLYAVALLSMQLNDLAVAEKHLKRLLELSSEREQEQAFSRINTNLLRYYLGQLAEENQRTQEALDWYAQVTPGEQYLPALNRASALQARLGKLDAGRALLRQAATAHAAERIQLLVIEAQLLANHAQPVAAFELLDQHLQAEPEQTTLLYEAALLADRLKRHDIMERYLRRLIKLKPDDAHAYNALGYSLADQGIRLDEARQLIDQGLALAPEDAFIIDSKGWLLYRIGEHAEALTLLRQAYQLRPDAEIAAHLGEVLWISDQPEEARKTWQESLRQNPDNLLLQDTMQKFLGGSSTPSASATEQD